MRRLLLVILLLAAGGARAERIEVGPGRSHALPSDALKLAFDGDVIAIDEGEYFDCLLIKGDGITIEGQGTGAVLTDTTCGGKAIIVVEGDRIVLRNLTLQRARVPDGNGAGIRAEGLALTVDRVRFLNDQGGIIAGDQKGAAILVRDSLFRGTGRCDGGRCTPAISVGAVDRLRIERTRITGTQGAHQLVSHARQTEIADSIIEDGADGSASFQVMIADGGGLVMENCSLQKGPRASNTRAAVLLDGAAGGPMVFRKNRYTNETGKSVPFVLDWSDASPVLQGNTVPPGDSEISSSGVLLHRAIVLARETKDAARALAGKAKRAVQSLIR